MMRAPMLLLGLLVLAGCSRGAEPPTAPPPPKFAPPKSPIPQPDDVALTAQVEPMSLAFAGTLPCADCPGVRTELTLTRKAAGWAEGTYRLVETYLDRGPPIVTKGDWTTLRGDAVDDDATVYELNPDDPKRARHFLRVGDDQAIRTLDGDMKALPKGLPDTLTRAR
ncbi:copper resistance protein NlpE [Phenylobacterium aquaticum]|uniref:copper resistance protein NlpE n=1 Tax=Phenylobacterium aquaticum TaxID=1763816 RepID=UPI0026EFD199|nr:copper resistance protein NlpE [Phenylobacterium aquaticum]